MRQSLDYFDDEDHWRSVQAESRGSKLLATYYQRKAWDSSGGYDGDRMGPIYHANSMRARYEKLHDRLTKFEQKLLDVIEQSPDLVEKRRPRWSLSKSSYIKGWQCPKYLYLDKYVPEGRTRHSEQTLAAFSEGRKFEQFVRLRGFKGAVDLGRLLGRNIIHYPGFTQYFLKKRASCILYDAGFSAENVLVLADIVVKHWFWLDIY